MQIQRSVKESKNNILLTLLFYSVIFVNCSCSAQTDQGSPDNDASSTDMMGNDPNTINPPNKQGYGINTPTSINDNPGSMNVILAIFKLVT